MANDALLEDLRYKIHVYTKDAISLIERGMTEKSIAASNLAILHQLQLDAEVRRGGLF